MLADLASHLANTIEHYLPGLLYTYDIEDLPRTNNERESEFRQLTQRLVRTTGQRGATRRMLLRSGAWETLPSPDTLDDLIEAFGAIEPDALSQERQRLQAHRARFASHTRNAYLSLGYAEQALQDYNHVIEINPHDASVFTNRGNAYAKLGQPER